MVKVTIIVVLIATYTWFVLQHIYGLTKPCTCFNYYHNYDNLYPKYDIFSTYHYIFLSCVYSFNHTFFSQCVKYRIIVIKNECLNIFAR